MTTRLPSVGLLALFVVTTTSGCLIPVPFRDHYRAVADPLAHQAVSVVETRGKMVTLDDGRTVELAGLDLESLDAGQRQVFFTRLTDLTQGRSVLVQELGNGKARLLALEEGKHSEFVNRMPNCFITIPMKKVGLLHRYVWVYPKRRDVGSMLLGEGLAKAVTDEVVDAKPMPKPARKTRVLIPPRASTKAITVETGYDGLVANGEGGRYYDSSGNSFPKWYEQTEQRAREKQRGIFEAVEDTVQQAGHKQP